ncbi:MAG TPA: hypothetical protein VL137_13035 [Polyangiaceae bacterium]|jgi:hypothetical protein|nr:hypothetical protein [Polyangiaceae bacterium]
MLGQPINPRLATTASLCAVMVTAAGVIAMLAAKGVLIASILLTVAFLAGIIGTAYANDRTLGYGIAALMAAALPLFLIFQGIGLTILTHMGVGVAGGLLVAIGATIGCLAIGMWLSLVRHRRTASQIT